MGCWRWVEAGLRLSLPATLRSSNLQKPVFPKWKWGLTPDVRSRESRCDGSQEASNLIFINMS